MTNPLLRDGHETSDQHNDTDQHHVAQQPVTASHTGAADDVAKHNEASQPESLSLRNSRERERRASHPSPDDDVHKPYRRFDNVTPEEPVSDQEEQEKPHANQDLEDARPKDHEYIREQAAGRTVSRGRDSPSGAQNREDPAQGIHFSPLATQIYTISYLILFSFFGTLARLGLQWITDYPGAPVFPSIWFNFGGSLVMGFLSEDRMLFRDEWGTPNYDQQIRKAKQDEEKGSSGPGSEHAAVDLAAAKKAHLATKKTIPLYVGLATGFCGSFTSFSSFIRDAFLAASNDLTYGSSTAEHRNGGYSFEALLAVFISTVATSLSGLYVGRHLAAALEPVTPSLPYLITRRFADRLAVFLALGCWVGAILLAAIPPADYWRGAATFALVFAPLGCLLRHFASKSLNALNPAFPLGTFAVNVFGTAILGMAWDLQHVPIGGVIGCQVLQGIEDGFCGCLTTVSTWMSELTSLRRRQAWVYGLVTVVASFAVMVAVMGGLRWKDGIQDLKCVH